MIETATHAAKSPEFLSRLHDGELEPGEAAAFDRHRAGCADCRVAVAEFERALSAYRAAPVAPVASDLSVRILRKIRATSPSRRPFGVMFGIDVRWAGVFAAALLVVIIGAPVFSRPKAAPTPAVPASSGPIPAYVLDAKEERSARAQAKPAPPAAQLRAAPKAAPPAAGPDLRAAAPPAKTNEVLANAAPDAERDDAAVHIGALDVAAPAAPPAPSQAAAEPSNEASAGLRARRQAVSAPAGAREAFADSGGAARSVRLTILAIDGQGTAPDLAGAPADERLVRFRGEEFVLVIESDGRVSSVEKRRTEKKLAKDEAAAGTAPSSAEGAELVLRELVFRPGDRSRRLTVAVE